MPRYKFYSFLALAVACGIATAYAPSLAGQIFASATGIFAVGVLFVDAFE